MKNSASLRLSVLLWNLRNVKQMISEISFVTNILLLKKIIKTLNMCENSDVPRDGSGL